MDDLNEFELAILEKLSSDHPVIKKHIPYLKVTQRRLSGAGMYVSLAYTEGSEALDFIPQLHLSTKGYLKMESLQDGLIDSTVVTDGKLNMIELVTYDEPWDGTVNKFFWTDKL